MINYVEYGYYDFASDEKETKDNIQKAIEFKPSTISVLPQYIKTIKKNIPNNITLSTIIDYPFGLSDHASREEAVKSAIQNGVSCIEIVCPNYFLCNRKYDKFRLEIDSLKTLCDVAGIELRYILEYKIYTLELLYKISEILCSKNLLTIYPSVSYSLDSIMDNIVVSMMLKKKHPKLNIVVNGQAWNEQQLDLILSNEHITSYKTTNIHTLEKLYRKIV